MTYDRRSARKSPDETVRARLGHAPAPEVAWSEVPTTDGLRDVTTRTRRDSSRVGLYSHDVGLLLDGDLDASDFEHKWRRRKRLAGGFELEWRASVVLAIKAAAGPPPEPFYRRRRAPARAR